MNENEKALLESLQAEHEHRINTRKYHWQLLQEDMKYSDDDKARSAKICIDLALSYLDFLEDNPELKWVKEKLRQAHDTLEVGHQVDRETGY